MIRYYFKMSQKEVDELTNQEWAEHFADLTWIRQKEAEISQDTN